MDGVIKYNDTVAAGNLYVALYAATNESPTNRLAISVQTASAGPNQKQFIPFISPVTLDPGYYFVACEDDDDLDRHVTVVALSAFLAPANINNGPACFYEAVAVPPLVATPLFADLATETIWQMLRVCAI